MWTVVRSREEFCRPDLPVLTVISESGVQVRDFSLGGRAVSEDLSGYRVVQPGDLVVNRLWARFGAYGVAEDEGVVSPAYWVLKIDCRGWVPRYLHYLLRSSPYVAEIGRVSKNMPPNGFDLPWSQFRRIRVDAIPPRRQAHIVDYLDRETTRIDDLVAKKQRLIDLLEEKRTALITQAVTKGLDPTVPMKDSGVPWIGEIPTHWVITQLKRVARVRYGLGQPPPSVKHGVPIIRATNINRGHISAENMAFAALEDLPLDRAPLLEAGEILVVRSGALTGDSATVTVEYVGAAPGYDLRVTPLSACPAFLAWVLLSSSAKAQIDVAKDRAAQPHINAEDLSSLLLAASPSLDEQSQIAQALDIGVARLDAVAENLAAQLRLVAEYRQALITAAVTGQIDVTVAAADPEEVVA